MKYEIINNTGVAHFKAKTLLGANKRASSLNRTYPKQAPWTVREIK